jgi:acetate kinase
MKIEMPHPGFTPAILSLNGGSSSLRFTLFKTDESLQQILTGKFERIGLPDAGLSLTDVRANRSDKRGIDAPNHVACVPLLVELLEQKAGDSVVSAIGYRVVHGGPRYRDPQRVDEVMLEEMVNGESGLLGVSEISSDMRDLQFTCSKKDRGVVPAGAQQFNVMLTYAGWHHCSGLLEPFCEPSWGYEWLCDHVGRIRILVSHDGSW